MKKISIGELIKFKRASEKSKYSFADKIKHETQNKENEGGGNYWIRSESALVSAFKQKNTIPIIEKIEEIQDLYHNPNLHDTTKLMYDRNLEILYNYGDINIEKWYPKPQIKILSKPRNGSVILINELPIRILPSQIFSFEKDNIKYIGGIWFVAKKGGFSREELATFSEAMYIYISKNFGNEYRISEENCRTIDMINRIEINYNMVMNKEISSLLKKIIKELKKLL